jgi:hypothetical protein
MLIQAVRAALHQGLWCLGLPAVKFKDALSDAAPLMTGAASDVAKAAFILVAMHELGITLVRLLTLCTVGALCI